MQLQLYLHFPFCKRKCCYCDFCSSPGTAEEMESYCRALEKEILVNAPLWRDWTVSTIYIGGGTPSILPASAMNRVMDTLLRSFRLEKDAEFTAEANPGTLREDWLETMLAHGLNRVSLGVQAAQERLLQTLGRIHTFQEAEQATTLCRKAGIQNLNLDLMFALPGQTMEDWRETLEKSCRLAPEHLSAYSLILEEHTPLWERARRGEIQIPGEDEAADLMEATREILEGKGYRQYEISNYAREGCQCRHNIGYWQGAWYLGLGVGAHSMLPPSPGDKDICRIRRANEEDRNRYVQACLAEESPTKQEQRISWREAMFETMMLGLRMNRGVDGQNFRRQFGQSPEQAYGPVLSRLTAQGLGLWTPEGGYTLTPRGRMVQNEVLLSLMD